MPVSYATRPEIERQPSRERLWPVAAVEVVHGDARPVLKVYGEVVAGREVELRALVAGVVAETGPGLVEGGVVKKGDLIVAIDEFDVRSALDDGPEMRLALSEEEQRALYNRVNLLLLTLLDLMAALPGTEVTLREAVEFLWRAGGAPPSAPPPGYRG